MLVAVDPKPFLPAGDAVPGRDPDARFYGRLRLCNLGFDFTH